MDSLSYIFQGGPLLASAVFALAFGLAIFAKVFGDDAVAKLPFLGKEFGKTEEQRRKVYLAKAVEVYKQGEKMFKDKAYRLTTQNGMRVVVPNSALDELRQFPESIINHSIVKDNVAEAKYTGLRGDFELFNNIIRKDLTRSLTRLNSRLVEEVATTVDDEFGPCEEWTTVPLYPKSIRIVATVAASIFVGPELCRNPQYLGTVIRFTGDLFGAVRSLRRWNPWLRPIGQYFVPELKTLATHRENIKKVMMPIIQERKAAAKRGDEVPDDMLQWMITKAEERGMADEELARFELSLAMAANHTTSITLLDVLSELAIRPDVIEELRAEIESVVDAKDGALTANSLFNMKLLDSVMRETQRMNPINESRFNRYVTKPVTLSSGLHLPAGVTIETSHTVTMRNPAFYTDPETFDAHRFVKLRNGTVPDPNNYQSPEQYQFVTVNKENLSFGFGAQSCPGRFFAANELKLILCYILRNYEFRLPGGARELPPKAVIGTSATPNPKMMLQLRRIKPSA